MGSLVVGPGLTQNILGEISATVWRYNEVNSASNISSQSTLTALFVDVLAADFIVRKKRPVGTMARGPLSQ
jgi:hypothetical protein